MRSAALALVALAACHETRPAVHPTVGATAPTARLPSLCPAALAKLALGDALHADPSSTSGLAGVLPDDAGRVVAVAAVDVDAAAPLALAVLTAPPGKHDILGDDLRLALYRCEPGGLVPVGADATLDATFEVAVEAATPIDFGEGLRYTALRVRAVVGAFAHDEETAEWILGPRGVVGKVVVAWRSSVDSDVHAPGWGSLDGSGWFPGGASVRYLSLQYGADVRDVAIRELAELDATGLHAVRRHGWAMLGRGALPAWCGRAVRCAAFARFQASALTFDWFAAGWSSAADARAALAAVGATVDDGAWAYLGDAPAPKAPDGEPPAARLASPR